MGSTLDETKYSCKQEQPTVEFPR